MFHFDGKQLPIISIRHAAEFFDYNAKYDDAGTIEEVIELPAELKERVNKASLACYKALKCSVYAGVDMMVKDGIPYVMEVNTLPGMTQSEFTTKKCRSRGIDYSKLLDMIIETSIRKRRRVLSNGIMNTFDSNKYVMMNTIRK